ncbi:MAG: hypothetical protein HFE96_11525 [Acutalibacter sp.]|nr:hypothetical protein [Acutalibacter sp.]
MAKIIKLIRTTSIPRQRKRKVLFCFKFIRPVLPSVSIFTRGEENYAWKEMAALNQSSVYWKKKRAHYRI